MISVCMVIATLEPGGAEKQLVLLATHLDRARFEPSVMAITRGGPYQAVLEQHGIPCEVIGKGRSVSPSCLLRMVRVLKRRHPDVVQTWLFTANAYGRAAARLAGVKRVIADELCVDEWKGPVRLGVDRVLAHFSDSIVANSSSVARWLRSAGIRVPLIETIPSAFDPAGFPARALGACAEVGPAPRLAAVGRLYPQKRYDVILRAMVRVAAVFPEARLTIAGEGPARPGLEHLIARLGLQGRVLMPGRVEDVPALLAESDVLLLASDYEGLPNCVMEAMYVGVPVVATDAPGTVDLVRDGETGVLVPRGDSRAFAEAVLSLLGDPERRRSLAERARAHVVESLSVERMVRAYEELYCRLAGA